MDFISIITELRTPQLAHVLNSLKLSKNQLKILQIFARISPINLLPAYAKKLNTTPSNYTINNISISFADFIQFIQRNGHLPQTNFQNIKNNLGDLITHFAAGFCNNEVLNFIVNYLSTNLQIKTSLVPFPIHSLPKEYQIMSDPVDAFFNNVCAMHVKINSNSNIHIHWILQETIDNQFSSLFKIDPLMPSTLDNLPTVSDRSHFFNNKPYVNSIDSAYGIDPGDKVRLAITGSHQNPIYSSGGRLNTSVIQSRIVLAEIQAKRDAAIQHYIKKFMSKNKAIENDVKSALQISSSDLQTAGYSSIYKYQKNLTNILNNPSLISTQQQNLSRALDVFSKVLSFYSKQRKRIVENFENRKTTQSQHIANQIGQYILKNKPRANKYPVVFFGNMSGTKQGSKVQWQTKKDYVQFPHYSIYDYLRWWGFRNKVGVFLADESYTSKAAYFQIFPTSYKNWFESAVKRQPQEWITIIETKISKIEVKLNNRVVQIDNKNKYFVNYVKFYCRYLSDMAGGFNIMRKYCNLFGLNSNLLDKNVIIYLNQANLKDIVIDKDCVDPNWQPSSGADIPVFALANRRKILRLNLCK